MFVKSAVQLLQGGGRRLLLNKPVFLINPALSSVRGLSSDDTDDDLVLTSEMDSRNEIDDVDEIEETDERTFEELEIDEANKVRTKLNLVTRSRLRNDRLVVVADEVHGTVPKHVKTDIAAFKDILSSVTSKNLESDSSEMSGAEKQAAAYKRKIDGKMGPEYVVEDQILQHPCPYAKELEIRDWDAEDKLLKFPVDNQDVVWEESTVDFSEHIFLHKYIVVFPKETHRFMETIISALQNNPDYTIEKKKQIIWSYYNYFEYHEDKLAEDDVEVIEV